MRKKLPAILLSVLLGMTVTACAAPGEPTEPGRVMPEISDMDVNELKSKEIASHEDGFTYSFDGDYIAIEEGVVYGLVAGTTTAVTAKSGYGETSFRVTVHAALTGAGDAPSAFTLQGNGYVKADDTYGESFCMLDGQPLNRDGFVATGSLAFNTRSVNADVRIILRDGDGKDVSLVATPDGSGYFATGVTENQIRDIGDYRQRRINFLVYVSDGAAYYYLNDMLVWHTYVNGNVQLGFGSQNAEVTLSRLSLAYNAALVDALKTEAHKTFGANIYGVRPNNSFAFEDLGGGVYRKITDAYHQQWLYFDADPVCGTDYTVTGTVEMLDPVTAAEVVWHCCNRDGKLMRVLLRYDTVNQFYYIFTDYELIGGFAGSRVCKERVPNRFDFTFRYRNGVTTFLIGDEVIVESDSASVNGVGYLGATHFGFAGQRCRIVLSDISVDMN